MYMCMRVCVCSCTCMCVNRFVCDCEYVSVYVCIYVCVVVREVDGWLWEFYCGFESL